MPLSTDFPLSGAAALVLGAGFGTRLLPLTEHVPKPVIPVLGRPLIGHPLIHLYAGGCHEVWVNAHHRADRLQATLEAWVQRRLLRLKVRWSVEQPEILGTAGALRLLEAELSTTGGPILLLNGDSILGLDLPALVAAHRRNRAEHGTLATLLCLPSPKAEHYGAVQVNADGRVLERTGLGRLAGATDADIAAATPTIFCGVHVIEPALLPHLPPAGEYGCIVRQGYIPLLAQGADLRAVLAPPDLFFHDVGTPERYLDAQAALMRSGDDAPLAVAPGVDLGGALFQEASYAAGADGREYGSPDAVAGLAGATLEPPFFFGPAIRVEAGATIGPDASVGAACVVGGGATVRDAALWHGVEVGAGERLHGVMAAKLGGERLVLDGRPA